MEKWINFYEPFFSGHEEVNAFVAQLEDVDLDHPRHRAKVMMHQAQRLITLADDIQDIRPGKAGLQLLFLIVCAENISKLFHNYEGEGQSRAYVHRFFNGFVVGRDRKMLEQSIATTALEHLNLQQVVDTLYSVRCDVVHEGQYWGFNFSDGRTPMITGDPPIIVRLRLAALRDIIVRGCIQAIKTYAAH